MSSRFKNRKILERLLFCLLKNKTTKRKNANTVFLIKIFSKKAIFAKKIAIFVKKKYFPCLR